jgi:predicted 2-oxoglutarate/Fe(II)-dependent dioxygenase YbiX
MIKNSIDNITVKNFLSENECQSLLETYSNEGLFKPSGIVGGVNDEVRKSSTFFINKIDFLDEKLLQSINENIKIKGVKIKNLGPHQFTKYSVGDFYDWHTDSDGDKNKYRNYSIVVQLNNDYEGGSLQLKDENQKEYDLERGTGNLFIFNSGTIHRVSKVISGVRYSLVNWVSLDKIEGYKKTLL